MATKDDLNGHVRELEAARVAEEPRVAAGQVGKNEVRLKKQVEETVTVVLQHERIAAGKRRRDIDAAPRGCIGGPGGSVVAIQALTLALPGIPGVERVVGYDQVKVAIAVEVGEGRRTEAARTRAGTGVDGEGGRRGAY